MISKIYILNGANGSGKKELTKAFKSVSKTEVISISPIDPIIELFSHVEVTDSDRVRRFLLSHTKDLLDDLVEYSVKYILGKVKEYKEDPDTYILIVKIKEEAIISLLSSLLDVETILITRDGENKNLPKDKILGSYVNYRYLIHLEKDDKLEDLKLVASEILYR